MRNPAYSSRVGRLVTQPIGGEEVSAYVPPPLPPVPPLDIPQLLHRLLAAQRGLGRLDGITTLLPHPKLFLYMYVRKEAVLSSQIEGTQSTLDDLLRFETDAKSGEPIDDIREVSNYVDALFHGLERLATLPLSLRLLREMHARLLNSGRGSRKTPGEFRRTQNWIGGDRPGNALFVPPPVSELEACLSDFERFIHEEASGLPALLKAGLLHVQFETIHPFLDGNGRLGRLLITLYLCSQGILAQPLLYLSLYLKTHRARYYDLLQAVREEGDWEAWLAFYLDGVAQTADQAFEAANRIVELLKADREMILAQSARPNTLMRVHDVLRERPYVTAKIVQDMTGLTNPPVTRALDALERMGLLEEVSG
ncbi:MAG: Fic family protein, partial [Pseudomonadota bacterium]